LKALHSNTTLWPLLADRAFYVTDDV